MVEYINIVANSAAYIITTILFIATILNANRKEKVFRWFFALVLITLIGSVLDTVVVLHMGIPGNNAYIILRIFDFCSYFVIGFALIAAGMYFYEFLSTKTRISRVFIYFQVCLAVMVSVLVIVAQFFPIVAWTDEYNNYYKGDFFWLYSLFPILTLLSCMWLTLANIRFLKTREWVALLLYLTVPIICYVLETLIAGIWITYLGSAIALFLIYVNIQVELKHKLSEKEAELARGRIAIMLSQIQPHFIFNTLSSISDLCVQNPLAQKSLITFSEYLRVNMDSLTRKQPIAFSMELEHVRQYLYLEQLRFEERLRVEYDIRAENFMLPVLTLQPIVENAVKHGQRSSGVTVKISTEEIGHGFRIVIMDDGVGFEAAAPRQDGRSHTGIENVRVRLAAMCHGRLSVESAPGRGTKVIIDLPGQEDEL